MILNRLREQPPIFRAILFCVVADTVCGQYFHAADSDRAYGLSLLLRALIWTWFAFYAIDYRHLLAKTFAFIFMLTSIGNIVMYFLPISAWLTVGPGIVFVIWLSYAYQRDYALNIDVTDKDRVYLITKAPDDWQSFLLSLIGRPTGGYGLLVRDNLYYYRKGRFVCEPRTKAPNKLIVKDTNMMATVELQHWLSAKVGEKHSWRHNCITIAWRAKRHAG